MLMLGWLPYTHAQVGVVWTCVAFEHVVVLLKMALRVTTATVPQHVVDDRFREAYFHQKVGGCRCVHKGGARLVARAVVLRGGVRHQALKAWREG